MSNQTNGEPDPQDPKNESQKPVQKPETPNSEPVSSGDEDMELTKKNFYNVNDDDY